MPQSFYRLNLGITKCYLLPCFGGYLLVDTAYPKDYGKFVKAIDRLGISLSEIKYLLLTHHHDDHAGFAAQLVAQTSCKVIAHQIYPAHGEPFPAEMLKYYKKVFTGE